MDESQIGEFIVHWSHKNYNERDDAHKQVSKVLDVPPYDDERKEAKAIDIEGKIKVQTGEVDVMQPVDYISPSQVVDVGVPADYGRVDN
jgi:hypothetical protein